MLAGSGPIPLRGDYAYEVKWDGFLAIVSMEDGLESGTGRDVLLDTERVLSGRLA